MKETPKKEKNNDMRRFHIGLKPTFGCQYCWYEDEACIGVQCRLVKVLSVGNPFTIFSKCILWIEFIENIF